MTSKITYKRTGPETREFVKGRRYEYNLQNRLAEIFDFGTDDLPNTADDVLLTEYSYDTAGIRTAKIDYEASPAQLTTCLIDPFNLTGYAQVLEETAFEDDGQSGWAPLSRIYYTIGDDVLAQTTSTYSSGWSSGSTKYLLYDGHGSTRQLASADQSIRQNYNYDAYGTLLQDSAAESNPGTTPQQDTSLLYAGEQYDNSAQMYYNRARYYNPLNGLFNRTDPYAGNTQDPQSLHKYLYCHNNPVNNIDPSGKFPLIVVALVICIAIVAFLLLVDSDITQFRKGLGNPLITDQDIIDSIKGYEQAANAVDEILGKGGYDNWNDFMDLLAEKGVRPVGERFGGVTKYGRNLSAGQQKIINYFEFNVNWMVENPEAHEHPSPTLYHGQHEQYATDWFTAEAKRMRIIVNYLREEARRRKIPGY